MSLELRLSLLTDDDKKALLDLLFKDYYFKDGVYEGQWNVLWYHLVDLGFLSDEDLDPSYPHAKHLYKYTDLFIELKEKLN